MTPFDLDSKTFSFERSKDCGVGLTEKELYSWLTTWLGFENYLHCHDNINAVYWFSGFKVNLGIKQGRPINVNNLEDVKER